MTAVLQSSDLNVHICIYVCLYVCVKMHVYIQLKKKRILVGTMGKVKMTS